MISFSSFVFSWRMRLSKIMRHKIVTFLIVLSAIVIVGLGPPAYQESWLNPFSTLNIPNRQLHPHWITSIGMRTSEDPFHSYQCVDEDKIQTLMHNLQTAAPLSTFSPQSEKIYYYTLHRAPSRFHQEMDFALKYFPNEHVIFFEQQYFKINEATVNSFTEIEGAMTPGWWK